MLCLRGCQRVVLASHLVRTPYLDIVVPTYMGRCSSGMSQDFARVPVPVPGQTCGDSGLMLTEVLARSPHC